MAAKSCIALAKTGGRIKHGCWESPHNAAVARLRRPAKVDADPPEHIGQIIILAVGLS